MLSNFGTGPVADGVGLFHVIGSYCGEFTISATSCREMMPDPAFYRECLQRSFEDLRDSTIGKPEANGRRRKPAARKKPAAKKAAPKRAATKKKAASTGRPAVRSKARSGAKAVPKRRAG